MTSSALLTLELDNARIADAFRGIAEAAPGTASGTVDYVPGGAVIEARAPLGTIAIMCAPDALSEDVAVNIAAALAAGNRVAVGLIDAPDRVLTSVLATLTGGLDHDEFWILGSDRRSWQQLGFGYVIVAISSAGVRVGESPRQPHLRTAPLDLIRRYTRVHRFGVSIDTCVVSRLPATEHSTKGTRS
ncbi:hypothetical protein ITJ64_05445 [Herbiconiux sp. VKM Ac-1786]|uniref:hypothetical protein n=1 Tax=Herbiconiux sp. VKM Ac-1786 TaxID=2783824 RepID=UPI00188A89D2|nr:hypothetical protein [Herbiconiux sp. VKM Ac-1786]MBF4571956.1 hypothetical protein [Herbiconiux sp. VKM Ac-1786]